jgi:hypothetical protein
MSSSPDPKPNSPASSAGIGTLIVFVAMLLAGMLVFWYYPFPSGSPPDVSSFVMFWLRELLILATLLVVAVYIGVALVLKRIRR